MNIRNRRDVNSPVAYLISTVEGVVDEAAVKRYAELAGPAIEQFGGGRCLERRTHTGRGGTALSSPVDGRVPVDGRGAGMV